MTIPNVMREQLNLKTGDKVGFLLKDDHVLLFRQENKIEKSFGILEAKNTVCLAEIEKVIARRGKEKE